MRDQGIYAVSEYNRTCPGRPYTVPLLSFLQPPHAGGASSNIRVQHTILVAEHFPKYHGDNFWTLEQTR
jgi:hypothetical protein